VNCSGEKITSSEITPERVYLDRRRFLLGGTALALSAISGLARAHCATAEIQTLKEPLTDIGTATRYNNYYEFSSDKKAVIYLAREFNPRPWTVSIEGEVRHPKVYDIDEISRLISAEERIYRLRCVEGWSMVVPWMGIPLCEVLNRADPTGDAKFVEFSSIMKPEVMIGQRSSVLPWPYTEGLRIDEAMHPLTLLAVGMYGKPLPNQNGAPLRLVVPWKYGFKSIKAIAKIRLVASMPASSWSRAAPSEYGFYANVNPNVAHPRWSQRRETRLGELTKRDTLPFNGYAEQVASLYQDMDLAINF
jgi:methionine sulfoxide reductase catalytic subunit